MMYVVAICIILGFAFGYVMGRDDERDAMAIADAKRRHPSSQSD